MKTLGHISIWRTKDTTLRQLITCAIKVDYAKGLHELPWYGLERIGIKQPKDDSDITLEQLDTILADADDMLLLEILDAQACERYR